MTSKLREALDTLGNLIQHVPHSEGPSPKQNGHCAACLRCKLVSAYANVTLAAPPPAQATEIREAEENLADYLLRNSPPTWDYKFVLNLARDVATSRVRGPVSRSVPAAKREGR